MRVYELKDKFRYLFHENYEKKEVIRRVSSCIKEKFNGFTFAQINLTKNQKQDLIPINIVYKPVKKQDEVINCFFTDDLKTHIEEFIIIHKGFVRLIHYMNAIIAMVFFIIKSKFEKHIRICGKKTGVLYDFNLQNVVTFEDNLKYRGDIPFCVYADFETTAPTPEYLNPENTAMFAVSYSLIFVWHPELCLPRQMVVRGYNHSLEQLSDMSYLTSEQLAMRNQITDSQLQDCILNVHSKKGKNAIAEMFNTELKFACDVLMCWFNEKFRKTRANLSNADSTQYRRLNPITSDTKCVICDFGIEVEPKGLKYKENNMSYLDFLIKKEYSFLKNIFDENDLKESKSICNLENYYDKMQLFYI